MVPFFALFGLDMGRLQTPCVSVHLTNMHHVSSAIYVRRKNTTKLRHNKIFSESTMLKLLCAKNKIIKTISPKTIVGGLINITILNFVFCIPSLLALKVETLEIFVNFFSGKLIFPYLSLQHHI